MPAKPAHSSPLPPGEGVGTQAEPAVAAGVETFSGCGLLSLPLESGHLLACRLFARSSIGPPYLAVWHCDADGLWTIHTNVAPARSCPRYFGPAIHRVGIGDIDLIWKGRSELSLFVRRPRLYLSLRLTSSPATRLLNAAARVAGAAWRSRRALQLMGRAAGSVLGTPPIVLSGRAPAGHHFSMRSRRVWQVSAAAVTLNGRDLGGISRLGTCLSLADLEIPPVPLFAAGSMTFRPPPEGGR